ncbi:MAG: spermidine/putrescine ABC transporter substrate-binding protein [Candidatus Dependentiae bacterium]|nr:spermidine/putrescine ABC transporter substrate-binding protein [Candidatus Dependentiae bacterium]
MMFPLWLRTLCVRLFFVLCVLMALAVFLYSPRFIRLRTEGKSITVLAWPQEIDASEFVAFEKETGIKVNIRYFESNEELAAKLLNKGAQGVDLVMPSDYAAQMFIKKGLLKKIDTSKLAFFKDLNPRLMGHFFDPHNEYTIPYYWGVYGIGFDKDYFGAQSPKASWGILFDKQYKSAHITMPDNARYLMLIVAQYLYGTIDNIDMHRSAQIQQLLMAQKPLVELYTESWGEYLLASKASALVVILSVDVAKAMKSFEHVDFMVPKEGSFLLIDSFALAANTQKEDLAYQFLNYLYRPDILQAYVDKFTFFPATTTVKPAFQPEQLQIPATDKVKKLDFYRNVVSKSTLRDFWISLKS